MPCNRPQLAAGSDDAADIDLRQHHRSTTPRRLQSYQCIGQTLLCVQTAAQTVLRHRPLTCQINISRSSAPARDAHYSCLRGLHLRLARRRDTSNCSSCNAEATCRLTRLNQGDLLGQNIPAPDQFHYAINENRIAEQQARLVRCAGIELRQRDLGTALPSAGTDGSRHSSWIFDVIRLQRAKSLFFQIQAVSTSPGTTVAANSTSIRHTAN